MYHRPDTIPISRSKLFAFLKGLGIKKSAARSMAYSKRRAKWQQQLLRELFGWHPTMKLNEIRLLKLFYVPLTTRQRARLEDNQYEWRLVD